MGENIDKTHDGVHAACLKFSDAIAALIGEKSRVIVFYAYFNPTTNEWCSGYQGNMNWLERKGALSMFAEEYSDPADKEEE